MDLVRRGVLLKCIKISDLNLAGGNLFIGAGFEFGLSMSLCGLGHGDTTRNHVLLISLAQTPY